jgi:hypothetical protein
MQLASTLFAVCIIQIKPQLEKLLRLPDDSLTKEIRLTQDLMELFIKYQIPSDLLTFDGDPNASPTVKIDAVKHYVSVMQAMINDSQQKEMQQQASQYIYSAMETREESFSIPQMEGDVARGAKRGRAKPQQQSQSTSSRQYNLSGASAAPPPAQPQQSQSTISQSRPPSKQPSSELSTEVDDYTTIPTELDRKFEILDEDSALRPTIIQPGQIWLKSSQAALLAEPVQQTLDVTLQTTEKSRAFDLLDALTRSGCLMIDQASLHVVMAATHCFDKTLIDTVIQDNVNPIEKVERSALIVATTIHNKPAVELVKPEQLERVSTYSPILFDLPQMKTQSLTLPVEQHQPLFHAKEAVKIQPDTTKL